MYRHFFVRALPFNLINPRNMRERQVVVQCRCHPYFSDFNPAECDQDAVFMVGQSVGEVQGGEVQGSLVLNPDQGLLQFAAAAPATSQGSGGYPAG
ncbi:MAG: hypothetical protein ABW185_06715 [Sedimenticola sp.]